ncbi:unnamed protein product, partial [Amoebophrya sp. A25]|eukprot:GSA25T00022775001.1
MQLSLIIPLFFVVVSRMYDIHLFCDFCTLSIIWKVALICLDARNMFEISHHIARNMFEISSILVGCHCLVLHVHLTNHLRVLLFNELAFIFKSSKLLCTVPEGASSVVIIVKMRIEIDNCYSLCLG